MFPNNNLPFPNHEIFDLAENPVQATHAELTRLASLFDGVTKKNSPRKRALPQLKIVQNRVLTPMDLRRMYFFRYGTEKPSD